MFARKALRALTRDYLIILVVIENKKNVIEIALLLVDIHSGDSNRSSKDDS
ncbi:MAG: hypothetical protein ACI90V_012909 [Bacillariaceae sp.]|jgi:hypothetical protein